jgi:hypothetical protein
VLIGILPQMRETLLFSGLLVLALIIVFFALVGLGRARRTASGRAPPPDPLQVARLRERARMFHLRGAITDITEADSLPGVHLQPLGSITVIRDKGQDASALLARTAAERYGDAKVLTQLRQRAQGDRVEWQATVCAAAPDDPALLPAEADGPYDAVLIDGANVVNWERNFGLSDRASLDPVIGVLTVLQAEGRGAHVLFDASIGYMISSRFLNERDLEKRLGKWRGLTVEVVPKGTVADICLINYALATGAVIVTNDLYRDHPRARFVTKRRGFSGHGVTEIFPPR